MNDSRWADGIALGSVRSRMVALVALAMLPTGALAIRAGLEAGASRSRALVAAQEERALAAVDRGLTMITQTVDVLGVVASDGGRLLASPQLCNRRLREVSEGYGAISVLVGADANGQGVCAAPERRGFDISSSPIVRRSLERGAYASGVVREPILAQTASFGASTVVTDAGGDIQGVFALGIDAESVFEGMGGVGRGNLVNAALVDQSREFVLMAPLGEGGRDVAEFVRAFDFKTLGPLSIERRDVNGLRLVAFPAQAPDLYIVAAIAPSAATLSSRIGDVAAVLNPLALWMLAVAAAWLAMEMAVVRPLKSLERVAQARAEGIPPTDDPGPAPPLEIRRVRSAVDDMAGRLLARSEQLESALREEKALLREVHHRVKNNLQTVASLLQIQARAADDDSEAWGLARAYDRVQLLALVHQRIYASGVVRDIRLDDLAADIARHLLGARGAAAASIGLVLNLQPSRCDADKVAAMAFLIGEGLTRAIDALSATSTPSELRLHVASEGDITRVAIDAAGAPAREVRPSVELRFIEAFARQLRARLGVLPDQPALLWCEAAGLAKEAETAA